MRGSTKYGIRQTTVYTCINLSSEEKLTSREMYTNSSSDNNDIRNVTATVEVAYNYKLK